jgi:gliding motility-associated-like protein
MGIHLRVIFLLMCISTAFFVRSQEIYNNCSSAFELCPNQNYTLNNIDATITFCPNCEDAFNYCFPTDNTIWMQFTTNAAGGNVQIDFSNLVFETNAGQDNDIQATIIQAVAACDASTYTQIGSCSSNETGNFSLNAVALLPSTTYYVVVDGDNTGAGVTDPAECTFDISISGTGITRPIPVTSIAASVNPVCLGEIVTFTASLMDCPDNGSFNWFINGVLVANTLDSLFSTSALVDGDIVSVETSCYSQCAEISAATTTAITVTSFPLSAGPDQTISLGESVILGGSTIVLDYTWSPSFLVSDPTALNPIAEPTETTTFTITATDGTCTQVDFATIFVRSEILIPNTFSPNNDDNNDTWVVKGLENYPSTGVTIYDRWGQLVFQSTGYTESKAWNGNSIRGKELAEGVFYYVLELNDSDKQVFKGSITLIR